MADVDSMPEDRKLKTTGKVGGFHESKLPFAKDAEPVLKHLDGQKYAVIAIDQETHELTLDQVGECACKAKQVQELLHTAEPRFYVLNFKKKLFVYCCPDNAPRKLRMLYSTAKANTLAQLKKLGFKPSVTLEISEPDDLDDNTIVGKHPSSSSSSSSAPQDKGKPGRKNSAPKTVVPSQMTGSLSEFMAKSLGKSAMSGGKKRVVLPPSGAYG
ncbi:hypothetical protein PTSG_11093 [Salpingoeca rosetta]|uniref:ADF-H domain-containing protein n=1 Tax=Salpingoeca rosetta (strain ATCC 50818 / BSB-021) TaxID=946362 RepID=F2US43_SALR5|nr:uncharacterized protein PTSG_11093 [Salpingoeca rosetta]EGD80448.1 hypothetical protein PTSG_11093 [Salpingoeca rosetta]|eukprot:XP_004988012.1 hypothetical protein PTSG_11093 [Salpingoeca rosetta]